MGDDGGGIGYFCVKTRGKKAKSTTKKHRENTGNFIFGNPGCISCEKDVFTFIPFNTDQ